MLSRRRLLAATGVVVLGGPLLASCSTPGRGELTGRLLESEAALPQPFQVPLTVPPVARPVRQDDTTDYYELVQREADVEILPGLTTTIWGYDGIFPGPTIVSRSGRRTVVRHRNLLRVPTVVHLHGGRTPADSDGYPTDLVLPLAGDHHGGDHGDMGGRLARGERDYAYPLDQRAATLWYHDHRMDFTGPQVWRGLAGLHIVTDDEEDALPLPRGDHDIPLMICDRAFDADGALRYPSRDPNLLGGTPGVDEDYLDGALGDVILVNGRPWPVLDVDATRYRFRILNASNARRYELAIEPEPDEAPFVQIGSDGGLLGAPVRHRTLPIAQAERFDVVVDFSGLAVGTELTMTNLLGDGPTADVMRFRVTRPGPVPEPPPLPERLADMTEFDELVEESATRTRTFDFEQGDERDGMRMWTVNGEVFDPERVDADPEVGDVEIWELTSDPAHPVHVHQVPFKVLSRESGDGRPRPTDAGWKDTIDLTDGERARILLRFDGYPGRYVFHCHNLEHEDMAMMANLELR